MPVETRTKTYFTNDSVIQLVEEHQINNIVTIKGSTRQNHWKGHSDPE